jgi:hypothetical protein
MMLKWMVTPSLIGSVQLTKLLRLKSRQRAIRNASRAAAEVARGLLPAVRRLVALDAHLRRLLVGLKGHVDAEKVANPVPGLALVRILAALPPQAAGLVRLLGLALYTCQ